MIPIRLRLFPEPHTVEWGTVRREQLAGEFFDQAVAGIQTEKSDIATMRERDARPAGFIFHASRCGSSLVANALACIDGTAVIAEAQPVGEAVERGDAPMIRAVLSAMSGVEGASHYVVKFRSGETLRIAAILEAWPHVPWVMLCRVPVEIIVSNLEQPAGWLAHKRRRKARMSDEQYCAVTIGHFYNRAAAAIQRGLGRGIGRVVDYADLNLATIVQIARDFGLPPDEAEQRAMAASMEFHSKKPDVQFTPDSQAKRERASAASIEMAAKFADGPYRRLLSLRP